MNRIDRDKEVNDSFLNQQIHRRNGLAGSNEYDEPLQEFGEPSRYHGSVNTTSSFMMTYQVADPFEHPNCLSKLENHPLKVRYDKYQEYEQTSVLPSNSLISETEQRKLNCGFNGNSMAKYNANSPHRYHIAPGEAKMNNERNDHKVPFVSSMKYQNEEYQNEFR